METKLKTIDILKDFHRITGARVSIHDLDFNEVAAFPDSLSPFCGKVQEKESVRARCFEADSKAFCKVRKTGEKFTYRCHCGLIETVAPIYNYGVLTGYFMMGQITDNQEDSLKLIESRSKNLFSDKAELQQYINSIPALHKNKLESYENILGVLAEYMTETNRLTAKDRDLAAAIKNYIHKFYYKKISVAQLCDMFLCSRTTLMNSFRNKYGTTIGDYLTEYRLKKAAKMLTDGDVNIKTIASDCGFSDQNYFAKVFQKFYGKTPSEYRIEP